MQSPVERFGDLVVGAAYLLHTEIGGDVSELTDGVPVELLGIGDIHGDLVAVFRRQETLEPEDLGGIHLVSEDDLNRWFWVLPRETND
jgi:hypothetical protein